MASVAKNCKIYLDGYDISGDFNALAIATQVDAKRATRFGHDAHIYEPALPMDRVEWAGFYRSDTDVQDALLRARLGVSGALFMCSRQTGADGERADFMRASQGNYSVNSDVGELATFDGSLFGVQADPMILGTILGTGSKAATGDGTARELGAVSATQKLYAMLQVFSGTGTLDVVVQSDTTGFPSPTTRITFGQKTGRAAEYATPVAGAITDTFWRASWTISGGPFVFAVAVGIL